MEEGQSSEGDRKSEEKENMNLKWRNLDRTKVCGGALVGKIMSMKSIHKPTVIKMIWKGWNLELREDLEIIEVGSHAFIFEFKCRDDFLRILRGKPWSIQEALDVENAIIIDSKFGKVVMVENPRVGDLVTRNFLRVQVIVDMNKSLVTSVWTMRPDMERPLWIRAQYERLQIYCYRCGRFGHDQKSCPDWREGEEEVALKYGNWLSVQLVRNIDAEIICCLEGWEEMKGRQSKKKKVVEEVPLVMNNLNSEPVRASKDTEAVDIEGDVRNNVNKDELKEGRVVGKVCRRNEAKKGIYVVPKQNEGFDYVEEDKKFKGDDLVTHVNVKSPGKSPEMSKAIMVYGSLSPISQVTCGVTKVKLKRDLEESDGREDLKRRKLKFDDIEEEIKIIKNDNLKVGARRSIRILKRRMRRDREVKVKRGDRREILMNKTQFDELAIVMTENSRCEEVNTEGNGGWPQAATIDP